MRIGCLRMLGSTPHAMQYKPSSGPPTAQACKQASTQPGTHHCTPSLQGGVVRLPL